MQLYALFSYFYLASMLIFTLQMQFVELCVIHFKRLIEAIFWMKCFTYIHRFFLLSKWIKNLVLLPSTAVKLIYIFISLPLVYMRSNGSLTESEYIWILIIIKWCKIHKFFVVHSFRIQCLQCNNLPILCVYKLLIYKKIISSSLASSLLLQFTFPICYRFYLSLTHVTFKNNHKLITVPIIHYRFTFFLSNFQYRLYLLSCCCCY